MSQSDTVRNDALRRFHRLSDLSNRKLEQLSQHSEFIEAKKKTCLVELGSKDNSSIFLVKGKVRLVAQDGNYKRVGGEKIMQFIIRCCLVVPGIIL